MPRHSLRRLRLPVRSTRQRSRLAIEPLEDRAVPANNLTIVDASVDDSAFVDVKTTGQTITISTKVPDAELSIATLQSALANAGPNIRDVVVTTDVAPGGTDGDQAGDIAWDATLAGDLDFTGFGTQKTLTFQTVAGTGAVGDITLTAVAFLNGGTDDRINLAFDTSETNGNVTFQDAGLGSSSVVYSAEAVADLIVTAGTGAFHFTDNGIDIGAADAGGLVLIKAGDVLISHQGGLTAQAVVIEPDTFTLTDGSGLFATGVLSIIADTTATVGDNAGMAAGLQLGLTAPQVTLGASFLTADSSLGVGGSTSLDMIGTSLVAGTIAVVGGTTLRVVGGDVTLAGVNMDAPGDLEISGTSSLNIDTADFVVGSNTSLTGGPATISGMNLQSGDSVSIEPRLLILRIRPSSPEWARSS